MNINSNSYKITHKPPMLTGRTYHNTIFYSGHVYVIGGNGGKCERFNLSGNSWEAIGTLLDVYDTASVVECDGELYVLGGGCNGEVLDLVQKLSWRTLIWEIMPVRLPAGAFDIACFKVEASIIHFVVKGTLYSYKPASLRIDPVETLTQHIQSYGGPSYYSEHILYCSSGEGKALKLKLTKV